MGEYEKKDERITDTIPKIHIDVNDEKVLCKSLRGTWSLHPDMINKPEGLVCLCEFPAGSTPHLVFWHDEVHFILAGKAELTYSMPRTRFSVEKKMTVEKGDAYLMPCGADIKFQVDPSGPLEAFCVVMPAPLRFTPELIPPECRWPE